MPDNNSTTGATNDNFPLPRAATAELRKGPGLRAAGSTIFSNPYVQVALTYFRRPFSSWQGWILASCFFLMLIVLLGIGHVVKQREFDPRHLTLIVFLFAYLAAHAKDQFADSRADLTPGFRRVHATVAAAAALMFAVIIPAMFACFLGWHPIGLVSVMVLLFGITSWAIVKDASWTSFAALAVCFALFGTESGRAWLRELTSGQLKLQAAAILGLGITMNLLVAIRLVRLNEDMPGYHSTGAIWGWEGRQMTRQWSDEGRILPGLRDWITERQMARLTRLALRARQSWWSRICRWQVGMTAGWSFWLWILGALIYAFTVTWWIPTNLPKPAGTIIVVTSFVLFFMPVIAVIQSAFQFKLGFVWLLPIQRKSYIRQFGAAAALSQLQLWAGLSVVLLIRWLLTGSLLAELALVAGVLVLSAAFQVGIFGMVVWAARYRSNARGGFVMAAAFFSAVVAVEIRLALLSPERWPHELMWVAGIIAVVGLLLTLGAYRRWLAADFD
ncbi:MAG: hypothetical protein ACLP9L_42550 [Thermoguttaceae bacterium]